MDKLAIAFGGIFMGIGAIFLGVILGALLGGIAGWIVGLVFGETILGLAGQLGIHGVTMFQLGVFLGFIGGFLKTKVSAEVKDAA